MFETKLQMRLESGEPKCANCAKWSQYFTNDAPEPSGLCKHGYVETSLFNRLVITTDLSVCSRWEMKDGQAKAEAPSE